MHVYSNPSVIVRNVSKTYFPEGRRAARLRSKINGSKELVEALKGVSLVAEEGDFIGLIGRNGSGKSTLMRLIAGNESPDEGGTILIKSPPTLLGVSAALQPKLTGLENIKLGLLAQGVNPDDLAKHSEQIQEFADIGSAINRPMSDYSSGMGARLKFSISTAVKRDILLVDEALSTGDASFNERAKDRMNGFLEDAGTIFLVSHTMATIKSMCNRAIWIDQGRVVADGDVEEVTWGYRRWAQKFSKRELEAADKIIEEFHRPSAGRSLILMSEVEEHFSSER